MKIKCRTCDQLFETLPQWQRHRDNTFACQYAEFDLHKEVSDEIPKRTPTPKLADESVKLLDNGWTIKLFKNALGSYTARAIKPKIVDPKRGTINTVIDTDDFSPSQALYCLTEKVFGNIV